MSVMLSRTEIKQLLIIAFIIFELLAVLFNSLFMKIHIYGGSFMFSYSMVFFCISFFAVDVMHNFFSPLTAEKMQLYKLFSQSLFIIISYSAVLIYSIEDSQFSIMLKGALRGLVSSSIAMYCGFQLMSKFLPRLVFNRDKHVSMVRRYIYATIPSEVVYSFIFCVCNYSTCYLFREVIDIFAVFMLFKIVCSILFSLVISLWFKTREYNELLQGRQCK